jgi:hypothetical protein
MNSYQKLKAKIRNLETKLMIVCTEPNSQNAVYIKAEEKLKASIEKAIWAGNPTPNILDTAWRKQ